MLSLIPRTTFKRILSLPPTVITRLSSSASRPPRKMSHPDFKTVEATREPWDKTSTFHVTKTADPSWTFGSGANSTHTDGADHVSIDPYAPGRAAHLNYKLLISAITPRPIAFLSTRSTTGEANLAPFSFFNIVASDPPIFTVGFSSPLETAKDTLRNLVETGECTINIISEGFLEAANSCAVDSPHGVSEWDVSGLTKAEDCVDVKCARVKEAVFSVEGKLESIKEFESRGTPGKKTTVMAIIEGTRFWARDDALDKDTGILDPAVSSDCYASDLRCKLTVAQVLRPMSRLGGIMYGRTTEAVELPRPGFEKDIGGKGGYEKLKSKAAAKKSNA